MSPHRLPTVGARTGVGYRYISYSCCAGLVCLFVFASGVARTYRRIAKGARKKGIGVHL
jgi:hypothetical protein